MIESHASLVIAAPPERVFDVAVAVETLPKVFVGYGPVPAIREAWLKNGGPMAVGAVRYVRNSDGSVIEERITALKRPRLQAYQLVAGFRPPFSWLLRRACGRWDFSALPEGTQIDWHFSFQPRSRLTAPLLALLVALFFRRAQRRCLARLAAMLESA